jgi:hypothetical protein
VSTKQAIIARATEVVAAELEAAAPAITRILDAAEAELDELECEGHPAGEFDPMGVTVYCDGSCRAARKADRV